MSLDHDDYATLARIEDHLRRIADALEATGRDSRQVDLTAPTAPRWDDCEARDPNRCEPGCTRPSLHDGDCKPAVANEYAPGGWAPEPHHEWRPGRHIAEGMTVRIIGADGSTRVGTVGEFRPSPIPDYAARVMADCETGDDALCLETGEPVPVHVAVTNRQTGATLFAGDMAKLPAGLIDLPQGGWSADALVRPMADPLDESDHRPRHDTDGRCWRKDGRWWRTDDPRNGNGALAETLAVLGPLTFCDHDDATIEAESGATD